MPNSLDGYLSELVTTAQACGAWPEMRELDTQCRDAFRDTLLRFKDSVKDSTLGPYRNSRATDKATIDRLARELALLKKAKAAR